MFYLPTYNQNLVKNCIIIKKRAIGAVIKVLLNKHRNFAIASATALFVAVLLQIFSMTKIHESLEIATSRKLLFYLRSKISEGSLDPRIKIFSMDDRTVSGLGKLDLDLEEWSTAIKALANQNPSAIFIDKIFDKMYSPVETAAFIDSSKQWNIPVFPIVFVYPGKIPFRNPVDETLVTIFQESFAEQLRLMTPKLAKTEPLSVYGAEAPLLSVFQGTGHTVYGGDGNAVLIYKTGGGAIIPHLGMLAAKQLAYENGKLEVDGHQAPVDHSMTTVVNFLSKEKYLRRSYSLLEVVTAAKKGKPITPVAAGDYVVILPSMYTGNTDWRETPFGALPGGYNAISILNSVLTGNWIRQVQDPGITIIASAGLLIFLGYFLSSTVLIYAALAAIALTFFTAASFFIYGGVLLSWIIPVAIMFIALIMLLVGKNQDAGIEKVRLTTELATAKIVHHTFFPPLNFASEKLVLASFYESSTECGGDWWMHSKVSDQIEYILIGDAIGHGVSAALVASVAYSVNSTFEQLKKIEHIAMPDPKNFMAILNAVLESMNSKTAVMTFQVAKIDWSDSTMEIASAGHTFPFVIPENVDDDRLTPDRRSLSIKATGNPLGIGVPSQLKTKKVSLKKGDRVVFYTDGIVENHGGNDGSPLRSLGLRKIVENSYHRDVGEMRNALVNSYLKYVGKHPKDDDATLVVVGII